MLTRFLILCALLTSCLVCSSQAYAGNKIIDPKLRLLLTEAINSESSFDDRFHAEVWLVDMSNRLERFIKDKDTRLNMLKHVHIEATDL